MPQQPLTNRIPVVNGDGTPTQYFIRLLQERGVTLDDKISAAEAQVLIDQGIAEWANDRDIIAGFGLDGGGNLSSDVTIDLNASLGDLNDVDFTTPPMTGQCLGFDGTSWVPTTFSGGGGGGAVSAIDSEKVDTAESSSSTTYTNLTTVGPTVTLITGTEAIITLTAIMSKDSGGSGNNAYISVAVSGATTIVAADVNGTTGSATAAPGFAIALARRFKITGLTPGSNTFTMQYRTNGGGSFTWEYRALTVEAIGGGGGGSGTVTSVDVDSDIPGITSSGGPVTTAGVITLDLTDVTAFRAAIGLSPLDSFFDISGTGDYIIIAGGSSVLSWE